MASMKIQDDLLRLRGSLDMDLETTEGVKTFKSFEEMGIKDNLLRGLYQYDFDKPSAIQQRAVAPIIQGRDVIAQAQSGTGKTSINALTVCHLLNLLLENSKEILEDQWDKPADLILSRYSKDDALIDENKAPPLMNKTKKVLHWKEDEHRLFLEGLEKYGRGNWKKISKHVGTKTHTQVASHAQKYFIRVDQQSVDSSKKSKRRSKFDTTLWNGDFHPLLYRDYIATMEGATAMEGAAEVTL